MQHQEYEKFLVKATLDPVLWNTAPTKWVRFALDHPNHMKWMVSVRSRPANYAYTEKDLSHRVGFDKDIAQKCNEIIAERILLNQL
jgi:hypothetical protein